MSKILVIGATGNVGGKLVPMLVKRGERVKAATRTPKTYKASSNQVEATYFDYDHLEMYATALHDVDRIFMLAMSADPLTYERLTPFVDAAKAANVQHILMMTAIGVEHDDENSLRRVEKYIEASGIAFTFMRPNWFMDNFSTGFIQPMIAESQRIFVPADESKTSFIATQDIAAVAAVILTETDDHQGKAYTLTGTQSLTYREAAQVLSNVIGDTIEYVPINDAAMRQNMSAAGFGAEQLDYFSNLFTFVRAGFTASVTVTVAQILQRDPTTFENFVSANASIWNE